MKINGENIKLPKRIPEVQKKLRWWILVLWLCTISVESTELELSSIEIILLYRLLIKSKCPYP